LGTIVNNAFHVEGILLNDSVLIVADSVDPSKSDGLEAPIGTLMIMPDGTTRRKVGPEDTDWDYWLPQKFITEADVVKLIKAHTKKCSNCQKGKSTLKDN
jgi:hypothetical protein